MLYCIQSNIPFNLAYFMEKRMVGMRIDDRLIPYARLLTRLFEVAKNKHPHQNHFITCKSMDPILSNINDFNLEQTDIEYAVQEYGASSSRGLELDLEECFEAQINEWLDEDTCIVAEDELAQIKW
ncbi:hypothetical protein Tco_0102761 [Tanacetum coccineum]